MINVVGNSKGVL